MYRHFELKRSLEWISHTKITRIACERVNPEKHQTKQANEDDEQEDWAQKETFSVYVCQRWNRGDKVQLEDESAIYQTLPLGSKSSIFLKYGQFI